MLTGDTVRDVAGRVDDPRLARNHYAPYIIRAMNRVYRTLCLDLLCVEKKMVMDWATRSDHSGTVNAHQTAVNQITLDSGHDIVTDDEVYGNSWSGKRTVTAYDATTITIDGLPVEVFDDDEIVTLSKSWPIPSDWIEPYRIALHGSDDITNTINFRPGEKFSYNTGLFTIDHGEFIMGTVDDDTYLEIWYMSTGLELVDKATANLSAGEVNRPEWSAHALDDILFYGTCIEVANDYPLYKNDLAKYNLLYERLAEFSYHKQSVTPNVVGGFGPRNFYNDVYEKPGYENQG